MRISRVQPSNVKDVLVA